MLLKNIYLNHFNEDHDPRNEMTDEEFFFNNIHIFCRDTRNLSPSLSYVNINIYNTLWICINGTATLFIDNIIFDMKEGEGIIVFPGQQHMRIPDKSLHGSWLLIRFSGKMPSWIQAQRMHKLVLPEESVDYLEKLSSVHENYIQSKNDKYKTACSCYLALLLNSLRSLAVIEKEKYEELSKKSANNYVRQACQMLMNPTYANLTFEQIAGKIGVTSTYLRYCMKKHIIASPGELRRAKRLSMAKHLLQHSGSSITLISEKTGFDSIYSFSRFFKKHVGMSPRSYRKQFR